jgi:hypothetical protein
MAGFSKLDNAQLKQSYTIAMLSTKGHNKNPGAAAPRNDWFIAHKSRLQIDRVWICSFKHPHSLAVSFQTTLWQALKESVVVLIGSVPVQASVSCSIAAQQKHVSAFRLRPPTTTSTGGGLQLNKNNLRTARCKITYNSLPRWAKF